eukprot:CAMPEP_0204463084 /NCGR_PEP_ID=MMETSP0471-20130131/6644_1 /ASSEMBLY_ACC=CAM_ASM_000602 /TAXON_ID=2969 /ORGANISM="Oxyrrhis marina" /LENGTH=57 /DNA_ID=CAMNT_0051464321 /DNA_START=34 /DNA_END=203 /DNA_ORIENTATION=-
MSPQSSIASRWSASAGVRIFRGDSSSSERPPSESAQPLVVSPSSPCVLASWISLRCS